MIRLQFSMAKHATSKSRREKPGELSLAKLLQ
jgi:hypothetical protein